MAGKRQPLTNSVDLSLGKLIGYKQLKVIETSDIRREQSAISTEPAGHVS